MGVTSGQRLPIGAVITSNSDSPTQSHTDERWPSGNRRGVQVAGQGSDKGGFPTSSQFLSRIFVVPKRDGLHRPVVNLRPLNQFMANVHFKMESLSIMRDLLRQQDWMVSIDLKDAYLSVAIWEVHRRYLHFMWQDTIYL